MLVGRIGGELRQKRHRPNEKSAMFRDAPPPLWQTLYSLDTWNHQLREALQRPDDEVHLTDAFLGVLFAGTEIERGSIVRVVAPKNHLPRQRLENDEG